MCCGPETKDARSARGKRSALIDVAPTCGTAFEGQHLFHATPASEIDQRPGRVLATIPAPEGGGSGLPGGRDAQGRGQIGPAEIPHQIDLTTGAITAHDRVQPLRHRCHWSTGDLPRHGEGGGFFWVVKRLRRSIRERETFSGERDAPGE